MTDISELLKAADEYHLETVNLDIYKEVTAKLRYKGLSWRKIAEFITENTNDVVDHTKLARTAASWGLEASFARDLPSCDDYVSALKRITIQDDERTMLIFHYNQPNRTATYTELANATGKVTYQYANKTYGSLSKKLCDEIDFKPFPNASGRPFFGSVIGMKYAYAGAKDEFQLVMHHELSKAIQKLELEK